MTYDPNLGRWLEEDPIGFDAGDMNLYRFVGNNPTNAVDPSGLMGEVKYIRYTWCGFNDEQRKQLMKDTGEAIVKLEKALAMLTENWDQLKKLATFKPIGTDKILIDQSYTKLSTVIVRSAGFGPYYHDPRKIYIGKIKNIFQQINCGQHLEFVESSRETEQQTEAFIRYFLYPTGERIRITKFFWQRDYERQVDIVVRELGRREWFDETNTGNVLRDAAEWQHIIDYLAKKYDEMRAKEKK